MTDKHRKYCAPAVFAITLFSMLVFFCIAHPIVILDADDWTYISASRLALPVPSFWNPCRILPETLMPYASGLAVLLIKPLTGDYIKSITLMNGLVLSVFIAFYILSFYRLLTKVLKLKEHTSVWFSLLFLLLHFLIYVDGETGNLHQFYSKDATCIYYYTIPAILNCTLVLYLFTSDIFRNFFDETAPLKKACLCLLIYLAVFSNLFQSVIIAAFCGMTLLIALCADFSVLRNRARFISFVRTNAMHIAVVLLWLISVLLEAIGGRAAESAAVSFAANLRFTLKIWFFSLVQLNIFFHLFFGLSVCCVLVLLFSGRLDRGTFRTIGLAAGMFVIISVFEVFLCSKVDPMYVGRPDVMFGLGFILIAAAVINFALTVKYFPRLGLLLPLMLLVVFTLVNTRMRTFAEANAIFATEDECMELNYIIIDEVLAAEERGETSVTVAVPDRGTGGDNWPQTYYMGRRVAESLYKHGMTRNLMEITIVTN